jgi:hypothetical protein
MYTRTLFHQNCAGYRVMQVTGARLDQSREHVTMMTKRGFPANLADSDLIPSKR